MIPHFSPLHGPTKREFARRPLRFAWRWEKEPHNKDQAPITTSSTPSNPAHRAALSRPSLLHHPDQRSINETPNTFLKDSRRSTL